MNWRRFRPLPALMVGIIIILVIGVSLFFRPGGNTAGDFFARSEGRIANEEAAQDYGAVEHDDADLLSSGSIQDEPAQLEQQQAQERTIASGLEDEEARDASGEVNGVTQQRNSIERMIIKSADLSLQVENVREVEAALGTQVEALGGYIVHVEMNGTGERMTANITFRVPADHFDEALTGVQGLAKKVLSHTISGDDVTEEFVDLQARLGNLEATRDRLRVLLEQAIEVEDALEVNLALSNVQGEIEQIQGRMEYLQQSAALSTVNVYLTPVPLIITQDSWQPLVVARNALRSLVELGQGLVNLAIVLLIWTPAWLPLLLFGWWSWRRLRRNHRSGAGPTAPTTA